MTQGQDIHLPDALAGLSGWLDVSGQPSAFSRDTDLTGLWSGEYWYVWGGPPTPFSAHIIDTGGDLAGTTLEPATFGTGPGELSAVITGTRGELSVRFTKVYDPAPGVHQKPIRYSGAVDAQFTMIEGEWTFPRRSTGSGRFVLVRVSRGAQAAGIEAAEVVELRR